MSEDTTHARMVRRSFLSRLAAATGGIGAMWIAPSAPASAQSATKREWRPSRHEQDNWLDALPGRHRIVFDATTPPGLSSTMMFANNYFLASQQAYGMKDSELAVVIVVRHLATPLAYNDAMWSKYGGPLSQLIKFTDPKTGQPPATNEYKSGREASLDALAGRGVELAVCAMATRVFADGIARRVSAESDAVYNELVANLIGHTRLVPAGIVTVNRAQERGYSLVHGG